MMRTKTSQVVMLLAVVTSVIGAIGITTGGEGLRLPNKYADAWRLFTMTQAGLSLGLMMLLFLQFYSIKVDEKDMLIRPLFALAISYFLLTLFVGYQLVQLMGNQFVTWRTPMSFIAFGVADVALVVLVRRVRHVAREALARDATLKITMVDTSKPGPDIEMPTGLPVTPNQV